LGLCRAKARRYKGNIRKRLLSHWNHENPAGWRIYEGGGGGKGKIVVICFVGRSR